MKKFHAIFVVLTAALLVTACSDTAETDAETQAGSIFESLLQEQHTHEEADESISEEKIGAILDHFSADAENDTQMVDVAAADAEAAVKSEGVMTYDEFAAAPMDSDVTIEAYVQAKQYWWDDKVTVYVQDPDGGYFLYDMVCSEEDYAKLTTGTKIQVTGYKTEWAGEVEIVDATFTFGEGTWIARPVDVTDLLGTDELIDHQNQLVSFKGMTVESIEYKNGAPGDDIYVNLLYKDISYCFCVEYYLTDETTDVYTAVGQLVAGDVVNVEGFLYWYDGVNTHITSVTKVD